MKTKNLTAIAALAALVIILQSVSSLIPMNVPIALVQIPIVIGACLYGRKCGAFLGFVFGAVVLCFLPKDQFSMGLLQLNPFATVFLILFKGTAAGWVSGAVFSLLKNHVYPAGIAAAIICPIVNTGLFILAMSTVFRSTLLQMSEGNNIVVFLLTTFIGINFLIELGINAVFSPAIVRIIKARS